MQHTYKYYEQAFASLHTNTQKGKPAPHKAFLLLAVIDLIEEGKIYCNQVELTEDLEHRYNMLWKKLLGKSLLFSPDIYKPYFHMGHEPFWRLVPAEGVELHGVVEPRYSKSWIRENYRYAVLDEDLFRLLQDATVRAQLRVILISNYLTNQPVEIPMSLAVNISSVVLIGQLLCALGA